MKILRFTRHRRPFAMILAILAQLPHLWLRNRRKSLRRNEGAGKVGTTFRGLEVLAASVGGRGFVSRLQRTRHAEAVRER